MTGPKRRCTCSQPQGGSPYCYRCRAMNEEALAAMTGPEQHANTVRAPVETIHKSLFHDEQDPGYAAALDLAILAERAATLEDTLREARNEIIDRGRPRLEWHSLVKRIDAALAGPQTKEQS